MHDQNNECGRENIIRQLLKVQAQVTVAPFVKCGETNVYCVDSHIKPNRNCKNKKYGCDTFWESGCTRNECNFTLTQIIGIEIPISFDAKVEIKEGIVCCGRPELENESEDRENKQFIMQI
ncbi:MAG: hypothetical protein PHS11_06725 [Eubacteriales bacterium]|nr:hypothetical protein [Eubacteriales bacterium]MDD3199605.1 hypothetical protein [Eubacteriales bacterium]